jgi:aarF domain-containing kinase
MLIGSIGLMTIGITVQTIHNEDSAQNYQQKTPQRVEGSQPFIENNWQKDIEGKPKNSLSPDESQSTFEMGLYVASQKEKEKIKTNYRNERMARKYTGWLYKVGFFFQDYVYEPIVTFGRFLELSVIFVPVFMLYPITYFGKTNRLGDRSGATLWYKLLRLAAELGGASYIKLGQWAASRTDIFNKGLCTELSNLHSNAKEHSFKETRKVLHETFNGVELDEIFDEFPETPIGCGAIAQVYLAKLNDRFTGTNDKHDSLVAVKVVHPRVETNISRDLKIMSFFANLIDCIPTMEWLSLPEEVEQFSILMNLQLDLRIESYNLNKFRGKFSKSNDVTFPKPRFSSKKVLIEDRVYGISMNKILEVKNMKHDKMLKYVSDKLIDSFLKMMILDNFTHADLHPGNIFVRFIKSDNYNKIPNEFNAFEVDELTTELNQLTLEELSIKLNDLVNDKYAPQLCFIDAGLVTELDDQNRFNFISLFNALAQFDGYKAGELMIERSKTPETAINKELFKIKVERLVNKVKERTFTLGSVSIGDLLDKMLGMVRSHHVRMEGDFVSIVVAILILEGICRQLDPDIDLFARWVFAWTIGFPTMQFYNC